MVPVLFTFYIQSVLKLKKNNSGAKRLNTIYALLFFPLQNAVCFIMLTCLVPVLFTFYIQGVLKLKINNSGVKRFKHTCDEFSHQQAAHRSSGSQKMSKFTAFQLSTERSSPTVALLSSRLLSRLLINSRFYLGHEPAK